MNSATTQNNLEIMSQNEIENCGWRVPSLDQLSKNMDKRLKKIRGENYNNENFLTNHNYKSTCHQS